MNNTVRTKYGDIQGKFEQNCFKFLGIPYAQAPIGDLRFRKPKTPTPWVGVKECTKFGSYCIQPNKLSLVDKSIKSSEDCLFLNIYTPGCDDKKRPVAVWIHGGAYLTGQASDYSKDGTKLCLDHNMVIVSIQYRLGAFGNVDFSNLSGANNRFDSNCGTWDQLAAINWVIENIANFGGNPDDIGLIGESAGACSVLTLVTTPYLKGKIKRAVLESPAPFLINTKENGILAAKDVLKNLNLTEDEAYKVAEIQAEILNQAVSKSVNNYVNYRPYTITTAPVVDGDLIPVLPYDAIMQGAADGVSILIGSTKDEGTLFAARKDNDLFPATEQQLDRFFKDHPEIDRQKILSLYPNYPKIESFQEIGKEIFFHLGAISMASHLTKYAPTYVYMYDYATPVLNLLKMKSVHCGNSALTSGNDVGFFAWGAKKNIQIVQKQIMYHWGNFLSCGNVNGKSSEIWKTFGDEQNTYFLGLKSHLEKAPYVKEQNVFGIIRPYGN